MPVLTAQPAPPAEASDERLLADCRIGKQEAWSALVNKYKNLVYSIPIKMGLYEEAPDILQAVFLDLLVNLPQVREPQALAKWVNSGFLPQMPALPGPGTAAISPGARNDRSAACRRGSQPGQSHY